MGEKANTPRILRINPEGKKPLDKLAIHWRIILKCILK
jgi:hypothetical protein